MATILLTEGDDSLSWCLKEMFGETAYSMLYAKSGDEAAALCGELESEIHLLIADVAMPNMSGVELARILRAKYPCLHILFISVYPEKVLSEYADVPPYRAFLQKPFLGRDLVMKVAEILGTLPS